MDRKIFITGDSWGVKEWTRHNANENAEEIDRTAHRGIETYFRDDGYEVHNLSSGGSSNKDSIDRLITYINKENNIYDVKKDFIFLIVTDPIRDLRPYHEYPEKIIKNIVSNKGWYNLIRHLFHEQCKRTNALAEKYNLKIHLIGGIASFNPKEVVEYNNLIPLIPSWYDFLLSEQEKKLIPDLPVWTSQTSDVHVDYIGLEHTKKFKARNFARQAINEFWNISEFHRIVHDSNPYFQLDNSHPDRNGHKLIYDFIIKYINGQS